MRAACIISGVTAGLLSIPTADAANKALANSNTVDTQIEARVEKLIEQLTLEEQVKLLYGKTYMDLHEIERLGIPSLTLADGPLGIRWETSTAFPASIALGATWDVELAHRFGIAMGKEWRNKGRRMWLGPCVGLVRVPQGGRNFETYGEDPVLNGRMAVASITGAQSQGIISCVKHYALNNQDYERFTVDIQADERTMHELYLPVFEAAVKEAGVWAVMCAYNQVDGHYCSASKTLLQDVLKDRWGFRGFVVSDWGAVHDTVGPANAGLDLEMDLETPVGKYWGGGKLLAAVKSGEVTESTIDEKVRRLLRAMASVGVLDDQWQPLNQELPESVKVAREIARDGLVLLKNEGKLLPLDPDKQQTIAMIGPNHHQARTGGGSSSRVVPPYAISPLAGIKAAAGEQVKILSAMGVRPYGVAPPAVDPEWLRTPDGEPGLLGEYYDNRELSGTPKLIRVDKTIDFHWGNNAPAVGMPNDNFSVRWKGTLTVPKTGAYLLGAASDDGARLKLNNQLIVNDWNDHALLLNEEKVVLEAGERYLIELEYYDHGQDAEIVLACRQKAAELEQALAAAKEADVAIVCVGLSEAVEGEGGDRPSMDLDPQQVALIKAVTQVNPKTVVCVIAGSQVGMQTWVDQVPAVMQAWYGGQEAGHAMADIVFGQHSPSGKLPMTFVRRWEDHPCYGHYPGNEYSEKLLMGYRYFDTKQVEPLYAFGYGLSYTTFDFSDLKVTKRSDGGADVLVQVTNTGARAGAEVVQCYVHARASSVELPEQRLAAFDKVYLEPGQGEMVKLVVRPRAFQYYDPERHDWRSVEGAFEIRVGNSSRQLPLSTVIEPIDNVTAQMTP